MGMLLLLLLLLEGKGGIFALDVGHIEGPIEL